MKSLTHEYWGSYQVKVILSIQIPWILYSVLCIIYFSDVLSLESLSDDEGGSGLWDVIAVTILILTVYLIVIEIRQMQGEGKDYFKSWR